ncbi:MAG: Hsp20/alpha crystallin family protein [Planctomycetota bacterium]|jgi:HSP20 family protein
MTFPYSFQVPAGRLPRDLGTLFDDWSAFPWSDANAGRNASAFPALNAWADDENLYVEAEIPGLGLEDIQITVLGEDLTLSGERQDVLEEGTSHHRRERGVGEFTRTLRLPSAVDAQRVEAQLKDGILGITLPKAEALRPRRITVKGS